jgi:hypothetical protein
METSAFQGLAELSLRSKLPTARRAAVALRFPKRALLVSRTDEVGNLGYGKVPGTSPGPKVPKCLAPRAILFRTASYGKARSVSGR